MSAATTSSLKRPLLPSITAFINPTYHILSTILIVLRSVFLVILSFLPGSCHAVTKISVANTSVIYHDGRALAACESGPLMRISLPTLETVGWYDGISCKGEYQNEDVSGDQLGGTDFLSFFKEWTTGHPKVDPISKELILYHSTFIPPYVHYSIIPSTYIGSNTTKHRLTNAPIPGMLSSKLMHDFGVSLSHTVILDLPLSLDARNLIYDRPLISYDYEGRSRFGIFPRWKPSEIRWVETDPCCIFHTANTWDDDTSSCPIIHMLVCRHTRPILVYAAGNLPIPGLPNRPLNGEEDECRLYYYCFHLPASPKHSYISYQFALSVIPFKYPTVRDDVSMSNARFVYGCSISDATFGVALGRSARVDCLVKMEVQHLIQRGLENPPTPITGSVDNRTVAEILKGDEKDDPIRIFKLPTGIYAEEPRFVPRVGGTSEDDGWLLSYVFDEKQLDTQGHAPPSSRSELWIIDARTMKQVVARIQLPQRVPYGLHGTWFPEQEVKHQRFIKSLRSLCRPSAEKQLDNVHIFVSWKLAWIMIREWTIKAIS